MNLDELKTQATSGLDAAFALGVQSAGGDKIFTQADLDNAVASAKTAMKASFLTLIQSEELDLESKLGSL